MSNSYFASLRWMPWSLVLITAMAGACVAEDAKEMDIYAVPETEDPAELAKFIENIMNFRPKTRDEAKTHGEKSPEAVKQAAERILELDKEGKTDASKLANRVLLQMRIIKMGGESQEEQTKLLEEVIAYLNKSEKLERMDLGLAVRLADSLENHGHPEAARAYETFGELLSKQDEKEVAQYGEMMKGSARRLSLVGKEMELSGKTMDGSEFNVADWKGKVVLVDFWATWCGPCIAEIPNVKKHYEKYHEKGFEVVGVSLDQDRQELEKFIKDREVPWTILHENDGTGNHPAAQHYGINAIPFMALIDREGKVVSISARGGELDKLLEEQFAEQN